MLAHWLQRFEPFRHRSADERATIARATRVLKLPAGRPFVDGGRRVRGTYFLWRGGVALRANDGTEARVTHEQEAARHAIVGEGRPVRDAVTLSPSVMLRVDLDAIDFLFHAPDALQYHVTEVRETPGLDWAHRFLANGFASNLPPAALQGVFREFVPASFDAGERVVVEGGVGNGFFVIREGRVRVFRDRVLADLGPGDWFGADALVSRRPRNASVTMLEEGTLLHLPAFRFRELIEGQLVRGVAAAPEGWRCIDVDRLAGGTGLRAALRNFAHDQRYVVTGRDAGRARLAVFLLAHRGIEARWLE